MMLLRSVALMAALVGCANAFVSPAGNSISRDTSLNVETIRKKEFVAAMAEELGCTKTDAEATLMATLTMISDVSCVTALLVSAEFGILRCDAVRL